MKNDYIVKKVYKSFVVVSILSVLTATAGMLIDNIVAGRFLGTDALGAMGVVSPIGLIFSAVGNISSSGGTSQAAQALGKGDRNKLNNLFSIAIMYVIAFGGLFTIFGLLFAPQIALLLGARTDLLEPTTSYLRGYFFGAIPTIMLPTLSGFVKIDGSGRMPLISIAVMSVADVILDLVMVLVFHLGMFGMALATTISYFLAVGVSFLHFTKKYHTLKFKLPKNFVTDFKAIVASGAPTAVSRICNTLQTLIFNNLLVITVGVGAVAALNVRTQTYNIIGAVTMGVGQALLPVAGMFFGEEDRTALRDTMKTTLRLGLTLSILVAVILIPAASVFPTLLGVKDPDIQRMSSVAIRFFAVSMPIQLVNTAWMNYYQCTKRSGLAIIICVLESFVYSVTAAVILIHLLGSNGIWTALLLGEVLTMLTLYLYIVRKNKKMAVTIADYMMLDKNFGDSALKKWELSIGNSMDEVMELSTKITEIGNTLNLDRHMVNALALTIEELAGNVVQHAFGPNEKKWFDLMILDKEDCMIVRMRDNGGMFDPMQYLHENKDTGNSKIGLELIYGICDDFQYNRAIGLNNLLIVLNKKQNSEISA